MNAALHDKFGFTRAKTVTCVTILSVVIGLLYILYPEYIDPVDFIAGSTNLIWIVLLEAVIVGYFFGVEKLREYVNPYAELKLGVWYDILIKYVAPITMTIILVYGLVGVDAVSPVSALVLILLMIASVVLAGIKWRGEE